MFKVCKNSKKKSDEFWIFAFYDGKMHISEARRLQNGKNMTPQGAPWCPLATQQASQPASRAKMPASQSKMGPKSQRAQN